MSLVCAKVGSQKQVLTFWFPPDVFNSSAPISAALANVKSSMSAPLPTHPFSVLTFDRMLTQSLPPAFPTFPHCRRPLSFAFRVSPQPTVPFSARFGGRWPLASSWLFELPIALRFEGQWTSSRRPERSIECRRNHKSVGGEFKGRPQVTLSVSPKDRLSNDRRVFLVEFVERHRGDGASHSRLVERPWHCTCPRQSRPH